MHDSPLAVPVSAAAVSGIVLAGGRSRRLGGRAASAGKAALELGGRTFLERVCATLGEEAGRTIVVAARGQPMPHLPAGVEIIRDSLPGAGPLAGLRDGLRHAVAPSHASGHADPVPPEAVVVSSCDVPLLRRSLVRLLVERLVTSRAVWAVPVIAGHPQVLVSAVRPALLPWIEARLGAGHHDLRGLVETLAGEPDGVTWITAAEAERVDPGLESFRDVDTPADLEEMLDRQSRLRRSD